ncbi:MAG TPA: hypothetical protein VFM02_00280 [Candidatus Paceibacterota bacterium]|nr:hypothetical protein [Candidatus Paceibacterota bacterium]
MNLQDFAKIFGFALSADLSSNPEFENAILSRCFVAAKLTDQEVETLARIYGIGYRVESIPQIALSSNSTYEEIEVLRNSAEKKLQEKGRESFQKILNAFNLKDVETTENQLRRQIENIQEELGRLKRILKDLQERVLRLEEKRIEEIEGERRSVVTYLRSFRLEAMEPPLPEGVLRVLEEEKKITTVGELMDIIQKGELQDIKGIGEKKEGVIRETVEEWVSRARGNPNISLSDESG